MKVKAAAEAIHAVKEGDDLSQMTSRPVLNPPACFYSPLKQINVHRFNDFNTFSNTDLAWE